MNSLELFRGTGSVGKVANQLHWNVVSLDLKKLILIVIYWIGTTNNIHQDIQPYVGVPSMYIFAVICCNNFAVYAAKCAGVGSVKKWSIWTNSINNLG